VPIARAFVRPSTRRGFLRRAGDYAAAIGLALLLAYWIVQGRW